MNRSVNLHRIFKVYTICLPCCTIAGSVLEGYEVGKKTQGSNNRSQRIFEGCAMGAIGGLLYGAFIPIMLPLWGISKAIDVATKV